LSPLKPSVSTKKGDVLKQRNQVPVRFDVVTSRASPTRGPIELLPKDHHVLSYDRECNRLLTQVNCRIANLARLRDTGATSKRITEQEFRQAVELRVELMRQIDDQNFVFDA
jgi:hypothetical protein